ncbi:MAG TPA: polysaccharide deacetylase family protein [Solirubrobacteraceae bacterium]|jgi:peptidoglycan/xylan/chitin deacetylase (PgdA/CDA1 family)|nr:polysaccharide deacetylase family protein [Solirubrobacteraceae bacterium]
MAPRWSWDFEDEPQPKPRARPLTPQPADAEAGAAPAAAPGAPGTPRREVLVRRRRALALLAALVLLAVIVALASGGSHHSGKSTHSRALAHAATRTPTDPEKDELQAVQSVLAYTPFVKEGTANAREIALTFDDGPGPFTPQVLSVLEHYHVRATFFVIGKMLRYFGNSTVREIEDGDVIGDHTETHPMLAHLSAHEQYEELFEQIARVELLGGRRPVLFRPPYGSFNAITLRELQRLHLLMVLWSVDTDDYQQPGVPVIVQRATEGMHPGAIILMHDAGGERQQTIEALPLIIKAARARGLKIVTVPQLLAADPPPHGQPVPPNLSGD